MEQLRNDEKKRTEVRLRVDWFARVLGEEWKTEGDGIYRHVPVPESKAAEQPLTSQSSLDELSDALAPGGRHEREAPSEKLADDNIDEPSTDRRPGSFWKR